MKSLVALTSLLFLAGCVIREVPDDGGGGGGGGGGDPVESQPVDPPPEEHHEVVPRWPHHYAASKRRYRQKEGVAFDMTLRVLRQCRSRISTASGKGRKYATIEAFLHGGDTKVRVSISRNNHKTYVRVNVWSRALTEYETKQWARKIRDMIHKEMNE